jgi:nitroreductase
MIAQPSPATRVSASDALAFIYARHSTRSYNDTPLAADTIGILLEAATHAPTAMHEEPWRFVVIQSAGVLTHVSDVAKRMATSDAARHGRLLRPPGAAGDGIASPLADPNFNIFYDARAAILICVEDATEFSVADCWLAAENLMLAAAALGLGTCCIGFALGALNTAQMKADLEMPSNAHVVAAIALGYPRGAATLGPRKPPVVWKWIRG